MFNFNLDYTTPINNDMDMTLRFGGYLQSSTQNYINNTHDWYGHEHEGFAIWNTSAAFSNDDFTISIYMKNIFNEMGTTAIFSENWMGTDAAQNYLGSGAKREITQPRTGGVALRYNF